MVSEGVHRLPRTVPDIQAPAQPTPAASGLPTCTHLPVLGAAGRTAYLTERGHPGAPRPLCTFKVHVHEDLVVPPRPCGAGAGAGARPLLSSPLCHPQTEAKGPWASLALQRGREPHAGRAEGAGRAPKNLGLGRTGNGF